MDPDGYCPHYDDYGQKAQRQLESSIYHKAFKRVLKGLSNKNLADLLIATQKPSNPYTTDEVSAITQEAASRLKTAKDTL